MAAKFSKGQKVQQVVKPIEGEVQGFQVDQETGDLQVLVAWEDDEGQHSRYFKEDDIELV
jgi:hypothetical protein